MKEIYNDKIDKIDNSDNNDNSDKNIKLLSENNDKNEKQNNEGRIAPQVLCTVAASFGSISIGFINGWSANALTSISDDPEFEVDPVSTSLIVGLISLGALLGSICNGKVLDLFGRKRTLMAASPLMIAGWIMIGLAPNMELILTGRFITGFSSGFVLSAVQIYSSETCQTRIRGRLGSLPALCLTLGVLFTNIATAKFSWRTSAYIGAGIAAIPFVTMMFAPESPYWMLIKNRKKEAQQILRRLRGPKYDIDSEIEEMLGKILSVGRNVKYSELLKPRTRYPLMVALLVMFGQQMSGAHIIMMYSGNILRAANSSIDSNLGTVLTGIAQVVGFFISLILVDKLERKTLIMTSLTLLSLAMTTLGFYFLSGQVFEVPWPGWIPVALLISVMLFYCIGCRNIPWIIASEVFNTSIRSRANSVCIVFNRFMNFAVVQVFPFFNASAGTYSVVFLHAALNIFCVICIKIFIPKMKGKTLEDIQDYFESKAEAKKLKKQTRW